MKAIVVVGSINQDMVFNCPRFPHRGETISASSFALHPGGKGANQAVAAARMGADVAMIGSVGNDSFGELLVQGMEEEGIDCRFVYKTDLATGCAGITVLPDGENAIMVYPGANGAATSELLAQADVLIEQAAVMLLQLEIPISTVLWAARHARAAGVPVILDPAPAQALPEELLALVDILTPNAGEAATLTGTEVSCWQTAARAAAMLREQGAKTVIVTMGQLGALYSADEGETRIKTPAVDSVDTTAAGDAFAGTLAAALARGLTINQAAEIAAIAGALAVTKPGARSSLPNLMAVKKVVNLPW